MKHYSHVRFSILGGTFPVSEKGPNCVVQVVAQSARTSVGAALFEDACVGCGADDGG